MAFPNLLFNKIEKVFGGEERIAISCQYNSIVYKNEVVQSCISVHQKV